MNNTIGESTPQKTSQVEEQLILAQKMVESLACAVDDLVTRLDPILSVEHDKKEGVGVPDQEVLVPFAQKIRELGGRIKCQKIKLIDLKHRVEL